MKERDSTLYTLRMINIAAIRNMFVGLLGDSKSNIYSMILISMSYFGPHKTSVHEPNLKTTRAMLRC